MGLRTSRTPGSGVHSTEFTAAPDVDINISISEVVLIMPFFRKTAEGNWVDATGDYDLCMSSDQTSYTFVNRRDVTTIFSYRYFSTYWMVTRRVT